MEESEALQNSPVTDLHFGGGNFQVTQESAAYNYEAPKGKPMKIMWSERDPLTGKTGIRSLFVNNLDLLSHTFSNLGTILYSCEGCEEDGKSKGFGFVQLDSGESDMMAANDALHNIVVMGKKIYVSKFASTRTESSEEPSFKNLYLENLAEDMTTEDLLPNKLSRLNHQGKSRAVGFVNYDLPAEAINAVEVLNSSLEGTNCFFVPRAQKKAERMELLKQQHEEIFSYHTEKLNASNLYVHNLDVPVDERKLEKHFSVSGKVISVRVMRYDNGISKRFGFVCLSTPEEATKALHTNNGSILEGRSLYVAFAQNKEDLARELKGNAGKQYYFLQNYQHQLSKQASSRACSSGGAAAASAHAQRYEDYERRREEYERRRI